MTALPAPRRVQDAGSAADLFASLVSRPHEIAAVAFLDPQWRLLGIAEFGGERGRVAPSFRAIVRDALALDAVAAILAHGHPSGDASPSAADLAFTRRLARTLRDVDVTLVDHLIFAGADVVSLRARGLL